MANNYNINYDDERFTQVENDKQQAMSDITNTYGGMISESDKYYQAQIDASKQWTDKQQQLQQENTDFAIEKIEQQKEQANKDYLKEQSGAYVDWQKQSNKYGANAEQMASSGLTGTGFSESSQVSMYNTYQNRIASARESYSKAVLNYDNAIKDAQLQNNSVLAEIAYKSLQTELELSLQGFQYKNQLILDQANKKLEVDNMYYNRYQDVLNQMNQENALAEEVRQYNESMQLQKDQFSEEIRQYNESMNWQKEQFAEELRQFEQTFALQQKEFDEKVKQFEQSYNLEVKQYNENIRQFNEEIERLKKKDEQENKLEIQKLELQKQQMEQQKLEAERDYKLKQQQLEEEKRQFEKEYSLKQQQMAEDKRQFNASLSASKSSGSSGGSSGGSKVSSSKGSSSSGISSSSGGSGSVSNESYAVNTAYYQGSLNNDAKKYGTFSNGYQPKGITGHGTLSKTGKTIQISTETKYGQKQKVVQNVWRAEDGTTWYWEGRQNKYIAIDI